MREKLQRRKGLVIFAVIVIIVCLLLQIPPVAEAVSKAGQKIIPNFPGANELATGAFAVGAIVGGLLLVYFGALASVTVVAVALVVIGLLLIGFGAWSLYSFWFKKKKPDNVTIQPGVK